MPDADHNPPLNLLVVDDEPNIRRTLCVSLTADGHRVVSAANARDAEKINRFADELNTEMQDVLAYQSLDHLWEKR